MRSTIATLGFLFACATLLSGQNGGDGARRRVTPEIWHPEIQQFTPAGAIQTEFGSALSESGYRKLAAALTWTPATERADYYFDAYDHGEFLLRTGGVPLKVRIKRKSDRPQWQVSRFVEKDQVAVGPLTVYVHTTESWEGELEGPHVAALLAATDNFALRLPAGGAPLRAAADAVEAAWRKLRADTDIPGLMVIDHTLAGQPYRFYPRKVTPAKKRLRAVLSDNAPDVTMMLDSETEVDATGRSVVTYEIEAEPNEPPDPAQSHAIALAIGRLMQRAGLTARDQQEVATESNEYTLRQLSR